MNRRQHLQQVASFIAASFVPRWAGAAALSRKQRIHMGAQTNAFGVPVKPFSHLLEVVGILSKLGYEGFETNVESLEEGAGQPAKWRREFEARHIKLIAANSGGELYNKEVTDRTIEKNRRVAGYTAEMGASLLIVGNGLRMVGGRFGTLDLSGIHSAAAGLNRLGEIAKKEGLKLCVHNERLPFKGHPTAESLIIKDTDPRLVWLNFDVGNPYSYVPNWNPAAFSRDHFRRIAVYHIKDVRLNAEGKPVNTELGTGAIDLKGVVAPLLNSGWDGWLDVEQEGDYPHGWPNPESTMRQARNYLHRITGV